MRPALERVLGAAARRTEPLLGGLLDIGPLRRLLHRRALRAWAATDAPLIVCHGNINRSPYAAALARQRGSAGALSAGLLPEPDRSSPPLTVEVARARGVGLDEHRSVPLREQLVGAATSIFVFDLENAVRLGVRFPAALHRTHFLGTLADRGPSIVPDPHGRDRAFLEGVLDQITSAVEDAARETAAQS